MLKGFVQLSGYVAVRMVGDVRIDIVGRVVRTRMVDWV